jgi:hypothetical protein
MRSVTPEPTDEIIAGSAEADWPGSLPHLRITSEGGLVRIKVNSDRSLKVGIFGPYRAIRRATGTAAARPRAGVELSFRCGRRCRFGYCSFDYRLIATPSRERKAYAVPASDLRK